MMKLNLEAAMRKRKRAQEEYCDEYGIPERMFEYDDRWPGGDISFMRPYGAIRRCAAEFAADD